MISLAPPLTIRCYAKKRGESFHHVVSVTCATVSIPNVSGADLNVKESHKTDVSMARADVSAWKILPPYTDFEKYMKTVLPDYVKWARFRTIDEEGVPTISKKTYKLVKSWKQNGEEPGIAEHPYWMNPRLTRQACGTIVPKKIRLERERRLQRKETRRRRR